jgi:uncharacterized protein (TIGR03118 family)
MSSIITRASQRVASFALIAAASAFSMHVHAAPPGNAYQVTNLVSDVGAISAPNHDPNLKNAWGIVFNPTGPVWVADDRTGLSTLYDGAGVPQSLVVKIPSANGTDAGSPTGIVFNGSSNFVVKNAAGVSSASIFIFASQDGVISGWSPNVDLTHAVTAAMNPAAIYKGLALAGNGDGLFLYAADFKGRKIDVYDATFTAVTTSGSFVDPQIPSDFSPFNIQNIEGNLYVAYAQRDPASNVQVVGAGLGFVDVFDADGNLLQQLVMHGHLNAPWGMALAPNGFGALSNSLLVANFGDGTINAYDPHTGNFNGELRDASGQPVMIDRLWGIAFGNGVDKQPTDTLFFSAGPNNYADGLYGRIDVATPQANGNGNSDSNGNSNGNGNGNSNTNSSDNSNGNDDGSES